MGNTDILPDVFLYASWVFSAGACSCRKQCQRDPLPEAAGRWGICIFTRGWFGIVYPSCTRIIHLIHHLVLRMSPDELNCFMPLVFKLPDTIPENAAKVWVKPSLFDSWICLSGIKQVEQALVFISLFSTKTVEWHLIPALNSDKIWKDLFHHGWRVLRCNDKDGACWRVKHISRNKKLCKMFSLESIFYLYFCVYIYAYNIQYMCIIYVFI